MTTILAIYLAGALIVCVLLIFFVRACDGQVRRALPFIAFFSALSWITLIGMLLTLLPVFKREKP